MDNLSSVRAEGGNLPGTMPGEGQPLSLYAEAEVRLPSKGRKISKNLSGRAVDWIDNSTRGAETATTG